MKIQVLKAVPDLILHTMRAKRSIVMMRSLKI